jgi:hypothetical protein
MVSSHISLDIPYRLFSSGVLIKILYSFFKSNAVKYFIHSIVSHLITVIIFDGVQVMKVTIM